MSARNQVRIELELGHEAWVRGSRGPGDPFTHDWQVFVRGAHETNQDSIKHYVDKVVFNLHETFKKSRRVYKEPPYSVRESGYAGFVFPIDIYLKNSGEPKKISFLYDLTLQPSGPALTHLRKETYLFTNPNEDFRARLLKGGAQLVKEREGSPPSSGSGRGLDRETMASKQSEKKHSKAAEQPMKMPTNSFQDLFGPPITKSSLAPPKPTEAKVKMDVKPTDKQAKPSDKETKRDSKQMDKKEKKEKDGERNKHKSDKDKKDKDKDKKDKDKEKSSKREKSPKAGPPKPTIIQKEEEPPATSVGGHKPKEETRESEEQRENSRKLKKEKREKERTKDKERKHANKHANTMSTGEEPILVAPALPDDKKDKEEKKVHKEKDGMKKEKKTASESVNVEKKEREVVKGEETVEGGKHHHKHKKRDKDRKERKEKEKKSKEGQVNKEEREKKVEKWDGDTGGDVTSKPIKRRVDSSEENGSSDDSSHEPPKKDTKSEYDESKRDKERRKKPALALVESKDSTPQIVVEPATPTPSTEQVASLLEVQAVAKGPSERKKQKKDKRHKHSKEEGSRKRKASTTIKEADSTVQDDTSQQKGAGAKGGPKEEEASSSAKDEATKHPPATKAAKKANHSKTIPPYTNTIGTTEVVGGAGVVTSSNNIITPDYMIMLRELQNKIMTLQDNAELQQVVQLIAETGQYELTRQTFDFDLCALDRTTVKRLQDFFSTTT